MSCWRRLAYYTFAYLRLTISGFPRDSRPCKKNDLVISLATVTVDENNMMIDETVPARFRGENILVKPELVDYVDVSPQQVVAVTTSCIPFLEHDDATRALMGANMQRQSVPLLKS